MIYEDDWALLAREISCYNRIFCLILPHQNLSISMSSILPSLKALSEEEQELILKAPAVVTVYIAGADNKIDRREEQRAAQIVQYRTFTSDVFLHDYFELVNKHFGAHMEELIAAWSPETGEASLRMVLEEVALILKKLPAEKATALRQSLRSLAKKVAESDGGFLHMGGISSEERKLIDLEMLGS